LDFEFRQPPFLKGSPPESHRPYLFKKSRAKQIKNGKAMGQGRNAEGTPEAWRNC